MKQKQENWLAMKQIKNQILEEETLQECSKIFQKVYTNQSNLP